MSYKKTVYADDMLRVESDDVNTSYHEIELQSEFNGELETITIDKTTGKITIRFKEDKRKKEFDENGDYIKPLDKDKDFIINTIGDKFDT